MKGIPLSVPDVLVGLQTGLVEVVYIPPVGGHLPPVVYKDKIYDRPSPSLSGRRDPDKKRDL